MNAVPIRGRDRPHGEDQGRISMTGNPGVDLHEFMDVDTAADPRALFRALDIGKATPGMRAIADEMMVLLRADRASSVLDLGCGLGDDTRQVAGTLPSGAASSGLT